MERAFCMSRRSPSWEGHWRCWKKATSSSWTSKTAHSICASVRKNSRDVARAGVRAAVFIHADTASCLCNTSGKLMKDATSTFSKELLQYRSQRFTDLDLSLCDHGPPGA